ncbi:Subtilisin-like serine protease [Mycoplasmoides gallisepticum str. R(low)]|uniref:Subtilisin-like serine protease n=2 Tax=Mycoplasmoides gallisepticum TaxID=2096 RepID=Q7NC12_MYCGA|nr:S8 family serine peptidase [Mycoplasmoides gallisepticum]AAP56447.1 Subtilisin-like serine protease [Mycoplasmoides gallisepticum str. R(low)]ADC30279.1 Subtilisin-like serine protease [Mycoplasmoides gallisepticum str. R(high)]
MKLKTFISVVSLGITTSVVPLSAALQKKEAEVPITNQLTKMKNYGLVNNSVQINKQEQKVPNEVVYGSDNSIYDFENNEYYEGFITFKGNAVVYDQNSILQLIKKQPQVLDARKSKIIENYYLVSFFFKKNSNDQEKFDHFLEKYDLSGDFYMKENNQAVETVEQSSAQFNYDPKTNRVWEKFLNRYNSNFESNGYTDYERSQAIVYTRNQLKYNNEKRIGVAVLEVGERENDSKALIDAIDPYYFDPKITNVRNRWDLFWRDGFRSLQYGNHSTKVGSIISGTNGVNLYHDLYGVKYNAFDFNAVHSGTAYSGLENEIDYIKRLNNLKIVNNSWGVRNSNSIPEAWYSYNFYSRYIDLVTANEREMIYVFSAGNNGNLAQKFKKLSRYQLAYNTIVVGSNDYNGKKSSLSSIGSYNTNVPLILANGSNYSFKNDFSSGTSFSAPFISGILANTLIQYKEKYKLGINSIIAKAALGVSSKYDNSNVQKGLDYEYGAGSLDYKKLSSAFNNLNYIRWTNNRQVLVNNVWSNKNTDNSLTVKKIFLRKGDVLRAGLSWLFNPERQTTYKRQLKETLNLTSSINYLSENYDLILKKGRLEKVSSKTLRNYEFIKYTVPEDGYYDLVVSKQSNRLVKPEIELALSWTTDVE